MRHSRSATSPFLVLVGPAGSGKSAVRAILAERLGAIALGPDDFYGDWNHLYDLLDASESAVVECCLLPSALRRKVRQRGAKIVHLRADENVRRQRLIDRGEPPRAVETLLPEVESIGYEDTIVPDLTIDTTTVTARQVADKIAPLTTSLRRSTPRAGSLGVR